MPRSLSEVILFRALLNFIADFDSIAFNNRYVTSVNWALFASKGI